MDPNVKVLGEIPAPRLGKLTVVHNEIADSWQIQLTRDGRQGPLITIAVIEGRVVHKKHEDFSKGEVHGIVITS